LDCGAALSRAQLSYEETMSRRFGGTAEHCRARRKKVVGKGESLRAVQISIRQSSRLAPQLDADILRQGGEMVLDVGRRNLQLLPLFDDWEF
jgi:hypothetical protein